MSVKQVDGPGKKEIENLIKNLTGKVAKVGWLDRSKYPNGVPVAMVASIQEFGAPSKNIPPRLGMRATVENKKKEWSEIIQNGAKAVAKGSWNATNVMSAVGLKAEGDFKKTISEVTTPRLKDETIAARLRKRRDKKTVGALDKPLIDSGLMHSTLTNSVEDE